MIIARRTMDFTPVFRRAIPLAYMPIVVFGVASSALGIAQALGWHPVHELNQAVQAGFLYNSTTQGAFLGLCIVTLFVYRSYWLIPALVPGLYLAHSRGGFAAVAFGFLATYFRRPLWLLVLVLAFGVALSYNPSPSDLQRMQIWYAAATHLTFWGNAWGSFWHLWIGNPAWWPVYVHNDYLQTVFELGVWSVIPFSLVAYTAAQTSAAAWPILVTFLFIACFSMPLHMPVVAALGAVAFLATISERFLNA